jgi:minor histocompatibility antigen H13
MSVFRKSYFHMCMLGYLLGLVTTIVVMNKFNAAQPALLYLVPACLLSCKHFSQ